MKLPHPLGTIAALVLSSLPLCAGTLVDDKFTAPTLPGRDLAPTRGSWRIADGLATCTQDDAAYAKNKNHGPILFYNVALTDGIVRFAIKGEKVQAFDLTLNNDQGHVFRIVLGTKPLSVRVWKDQNHDGKPDALPVKDGPTLAEGAWTQVEVKFAGDQCTVSVGDKFTQTFSHPGLTLKKTRLGLGFSFGTLAIRDVSVTTP